MNGLYKWVLVQWEGFYLVGGNWEFKINFSWISVLFGSKVQYIQVFSVMESLRKVCFKELFLIYFIFIYREIQLI